MFDLTEMGFIDSSGIQALVNVSLYARRHGATMRVAGLQARPARVFDFLCLGEQIPVHAAFEDALRAALTHTPMPTHRADPAGDTPA